MSRRERSAGAEERVGVLTMAYGTPAGPEQIADYYTHIRGGRAPAPELLTVLRRRYEAIGGRSPLLEITRAQVAALELALRQRYAGVHVVLGMKHAPPFIEDAVGELLAAGVDRVVAVVLAPHYSRLSVGEYAQRVRAALEAVPGAPRLSLVSDWHLAPPYLRLLARAVGEARATLPSDLRERARVLFTAHSLPTRILETGDPYPAQLRETAAAVAELAGLEHWDVAWQSAGRTAEPWLRPDVLEALDAEAERCGGNGAVIVCAAGFVADHLEILYDLDVEARARASRLGLAFARTASPNDAPELIDALAGVVSAQIDALAGAAGTQIDEGPR